MFDKHHLRDNNETWASHFGFAFEVAATAMIGSILLFVHAVFPFLFPKKGGDYINKASNLIWYKRYQHAILKDIFKNNETI